MNTPYLTNILKIYRIVLSSILYLTLTYNIYGSAENIEEINHQLEKKIYSYKDNIKIIMGVVKDLRQERKVLRDNNEEVNEKSEFNKKQMVINNLQISKLLQKGAKISQTYNKRNMFHRHTNILYARELQLNLLKIKLLENKHEDLFNECESFSKDINVNNETIKMLSEDIETLESLLLLYRKKVKYISKIYRSEDHNKILDLLPEAFNYSIYDLTNIMLEDLNQPLKVAIPNKELRLLELESESIFNNYYMITLTKLQENQKKLEARLEIIDAENIRNEFIAQIFEIYGYNSEQSQKAINFFENLAKAIFSLKMAATVISSEEVGCEDSKLDFYRSLSLSILEGVTGLSENIPVLKSIVYGVSAYGVAYIRTKQLNDNKTLYFDRDSMLFSTQLSYLAAKEIIEYLDWEKICNKKKLNVQVLASTLAGFWEKSLLSKRLPAILPTLEFSPSSIEENQMAILLSGYNKNYTKVVGTVFYSKISSKKIFRKMHKYLK
ncbi:MAG: hypothetical protein AB8G05_11685 [Oligoflexales bacterium]